MNIPKAATRSACDRCRAKRVRCPRAQVSTAPCARCVRVGAQCVTGSPGHLGRPRKARPFNDSISGGATMTPASVYSPACGPTPQENDRVELHPPAAENFTSINVPTEWFDAGAMSLSLLDDFTGAADGSHTMYTGQSSEHMLDYDVLLDSHGHMSDPSSVQCPSAATSLMRLQEKIENHISAIGSLFSDSRNIIEDCQEDGSMSMAAGNPVATALTCTKELIDIIQILTTTRSAVSGSFSDNQLVSMDTTSTTRTDSLSTETALLILSSYLTLMRLFDCLFDGVCRCFHQRSLDTIRSIKVKAVLRIGGISSLQDMPVKAYAMGIIDIIRCQIEALECCIGVPAEYCLSGETSAALSTQGIFASADRVRLFNAVITQEDVHSHSGNKSYAVSIRENMRDFIAFFGD
ncbi:hypothetical protein F4777DRAFT_70697 [Nemania sp. FL0916]|nr:hypothetical protein F4777DRAFT_70697 [Nemania sp. FL0916]